MRGEKMIGFEFNEEQIQLRDMARKFAEQEIRPVAVELDKDPRHPFPRELFNKMAENGFFGMFIPEEYGGSGLDLMTMAIVSEELGAGDAGVSVALLEGFFVTVPIAIYGTEEQKKNYLVFLADKKQARLGTACITEPEHGSDIAVMDSTAKLDGDSYVVNGTKRFITNAGVAEVYLVFAMTDKSKKAHGMSAFILTPDTPGMSIGKVEDKMGQRLAQNAEVIFEDALVPKENILGKEGDGFKIVQNIFEMGRAIYSGAVAVGVARAAFEYALQYSKVREQFGKPIFSNQAISFRLAEMATLIESARLLVWEACWLVDNNRPATKLACMAKYHSAEVVMKVTTDAVQTLGGYGYMKDYPVEKYMRDAKVFQIMLGTGEIQRLVISRNL
jgi:alkylation response protein AidB-like acyl-CoA dehydrogenase